MNVPGLHLNDMHQQIKKARSPLVTHVITPAQMACLSSSLDYVVCVWLCLVTFFCMLRTMFIVIHTTNNTVIVGSLPQNNKYGLCDNKQHMGS